MIDQANMRDNGAGGSRNGAGIPSCDGVRPLITAYMTHELGDNQSALVRKHLHRCPNCQAAVREIQQALDLLAAYSPRPPLPDRLSDKRRAKIRRAYTHPVISWIETHHIPFSLTTAAIALAILFAFLGRGKILSMQPPEETIPVDWVVRENVKLDELPSEEIQLFSAENLLQDAEPKTDHGAPAPTIQQVPPTRHGVTQPVGQPARQDLVASYQAHGTLAIFASIVLLIAWVLLRIKLVTAVTREPTDDGMTVDGPAPFE